MISKKSVSNVIENRHKSRCQWGVTLDTGRTSSEESAFVSDDVLGGAGPWFAEVMSEELNQGRQGAES